jgi:hypothetical protein
MGFARAFPHTRNCAFPRRFAFGREGWLFSCEKSTCVRRKLRCRFGCPTSAFARPHCLNAAWSAEWSRLRGDVRSSRWPALHTAQRFGVRHGARTFEGRVLPNRPSIPLIGAEPSGGCASLGTDWASLGGIDLPKQHEPDLR